MSKQTVLVTGANSGIGFETALGLARAGADIVMGCRNLDKGEQARSYILEQAPGVRVILMRLDVSDLDSGHEFACQFHRQVGELDVLVNNAGIALVPLARTKPGHELHLATNYLGAFALTGLLLRCFRRGAPTRIVNVSSLAHRFGKLDPGDLNWHTKPYSEWKAYANSKVAIVSYTLELNRRLRRAGRQTIALAAHPGFANTSIKTKSPLLAPRNAVHRWLQEQMARWIPTAADAARPIIRAVTGESEGGDYYGPGGLFEISGRPAEARVNPIARDSVIGAQLWRVSEAMTGVRYLSDH